jgi:hypothetical protein
MKYKERRKLHSIHLQRTYGGTMNVGGKEPQQGMKLNFKKHNLSPQTRLRISYLPPHVILTPVYRTTFRCDICIFFEYYHVS